MNYKIRVGKLLHHVHILRHIDRLVFVSFSLGTLTQPQRNVLHRSMHMESHLSLHHQEAEDPSDYSLPFAFLLFDLQIALLSVANPQLGEVRTQYFLKDLGSGLGFALVHRTDSVSIFCELKLLVIPLLES